MTLPLPMPMPAETLLSSPTRAVKLARFTVRALRITASTVAVVALLRQQWLAGSCFSLAWLLILVAPRIFPSLDADTPQPASD